MTKGRRLATTSRIPEQTGGDVMWKCKYCGAWNPLLLWFCRKCKGSVLGQEVTT
jgi:ribosomal protein L37AE/L43A